MPSTRQPNTVLGLIGKKRAGKSTASTYLAEVYGATQLRHSAVLEEALIVLRVDPRARTNCSALFLGLKDKFGEDIITRRIIHDITAAHARSPTLVVIDGIRWPGEVQAYQVAFGSQFRLVTVQAPPEVRYARQIADKHGRRGEAEMSYEDFLAAEATGGDAGIDSILAMGEPLVNDSKSLEDLYVTLSALMRRNNISRP